MLLTFSLFINATSFISMTAGPVVAVLLLRRCDLFNMFLNIVTIYFITGACCNIYIIRIYTHYSRNAVELSASSYFPVTVSGRSGARLPRSIQATGVLATQLCRDARIKDAGDDAAAATVVHAMI